MIERYRRRFSAMVVIAVAGVPGVVGPDLTPVTHAATIAGFFSRAHAARALAGAISRGGVFQMIERCRLEISVTVVIVAVAGVHCRHPRRNRSGLAVALKSAPNQN